MTNGNHINLNIKSYLFVWIFIGLRLSKIANESLDTILLKLRSKLLFYFLKFTWLQKTPTANHSWQTSLSILQIFSVVVAESTDNIKLKRYVEGKWSGTRSQVERGRGESANRTLQQGCSVVNWLVGDHLVGGADAPRVSQPVQVLDVTPAIVPHFGQICGGRGRDQMRRETGRRRKKKERCGGRVGQAAEIICKKNGTHT